MHVRERQRVVIKQDTCFHQQNKHKLTKERLKSSTEELQSQESFTVESTLFTQHNHKRSNHEALNYFPH